MSVQDTITITKEQITDGEIKRCILAHKAGISPELIAYDLKSNALTFERCTPVTDMSKYYYDIYDLLFEGIKYSRELAHCDPGPMCSSEKGCNLMLLDGKPVFIDWGEVCSDISSNDSPAVTAVDVFMKYWFRPATGYNIRKEEKILDKLRELKEYVSTKHGLNIKDETNYETALKKKIQMKQKEEQDQNDRLAAKLARLRSKSRGGGNERHRQDQRRKSKGIKSKGIKSKGIKSKGRKSKGRRITRKI